MGAILSRPYYWAHTKVTNAVTAVTTKVRNTRDGIYRRIGETRDGIYRRVDNAKNAVYTRIGNCRDAVLGRITQANDAVYTTVGSVKQGAVRRVNNSIEFAVNTKNGCVRKYTNTKNACITRYTNTKNACVATYTNAKDAVVTRYTNSRDYVHAKYTNSKNRCTEIYRSWRYHEYTRWEKVKYSVLLVLCLYLSALALLTTRDVYRGDYGVAQERLERVQANLKHCAQTLWELVVKVIEHVWNVTCIAMQYLYKGTRICLTYVLHGLKIAGEYSLKYSKIALEYLWHGLTVAARYFWIACQTAWEYFVFGMKETALFLWQIAKVVASYLQQGAYIIWQYFVAGCKLSGEYVVIGAKAGAEYTVIGSKLAARWLQEAAVYSYEHGSVAAKEGSVRFVKYLFYFLTNFRQASGEAIVWLWETSVWLAVNLVIGVKEGSVLLWHGTKLAVNGTYHGSIATARGVATATATTYDVSKTATIVTIDSIVYGSNVSWHFAKTAYAYGSYGVTTAARKTINGVIATTSFIYNTTRDVSVFTYDSAIATSKFISVWSRHVASSTVDFLRVAVNDYLLEWLYTLGVFLWQWLCTLSVSLWSFVSECSLMFINLLLTVTSTVYRIVYTIVSFVYNIGHTIATVIRTISNGLVFCVRLVFKAVIWLLQEFLFGYLYMLNQYNMYRELIFAAFAVLISMYCSGLVRDRNAFDTNDDADFSDDEVDGDLLDFELSERSESKPSAVATDGASGDRHRSRGANPLAAIDGAMTSADPQPLSVTGVKQRQTATVKPLPKASAAGDVTSPPQHPPKYSARGALPSYDAAQSGDVLPTAAAAAAAAAAQRRRSVTDSLPSSDDSEDDFLLDDDALPDFMHLSDSDAELEPTLVTSQALPTAAAAVLASSTQSPGDISAGSVMNFATSLATGGVAVTEDDLLPCSDDDDDDAAFERTLVAELVESGLTKPQDDTAHDITDAAAAATDVGQAEPEVDGSPGDAEPSENAATSAMESSASEVISDATDTTQMEVEHSDVNVNTMTEDATDAGNDDIDVEFECDEFGNPV